MIVYTRTELPKYTREQALAEAPELAWKHKTMPHKANADCQAVADYRYEGRS